MNRRLSNTLALLPVLGAFSITIAQGQNQSLPYVEQGIQNAINSGAITNPGQAQQLDSRAAGIQNQASQEASRNGGFLTPQQQAQINRETAKLNKQANRDVRMDNPNMNSNWRPPYGQQPGYNQNWTPQQQQQWQQQQQLQQQQWLQNHPNAQQQSNPYHHHHRPWNQQNNP